MVRHWWKALEALLTNRSAGGGYASDPDIGTHNTDLSTFMIDTINLTIVGLHARRSAAASRAIDRFRRQWTFQWLPQNTSRGRKLVPLKCRLWTPPKKQALNERWYVVRCSRLSGL